MKMKKYMKQACLMAVAGCNSTEPSSRFHNQNNVGVAKLKAVLIIFNRESFLDLTNAYRFYPRSGCLKDLDPGTGVAALPYFVQRQRFRQLCRISGFY
jgi:hypothetical protein